MLVFQPAAARPFSLNVHWGTPSRPQPEGHPWAAGSGDREKGLGQPEQLEEFE